MRFVPELLTVDTELGVLNMKEVADISGFSSSVARILANQFNAGSVDLERLLRPKFYAEPPVNIIHVLPEFSPAIKPRVYESGKFKYRERMW